MADITMCVSTDCPQRETCYRAKASPDKLQSYANFEYVCNEESGFQDYCPVLEIITFNKIDEERHFV